MSWFDDETYQGPEGAGGAPLAGSFDPAVAVPGEWYNPAGQWPSAPVPPPVVDPTVTTTTKTDAPTSTDPYGVLNRAYSGLMPDVTRPEPFYYDPFNAPAPFAPPSSQDVLNGDPGYGFRVGQGKQALEQSAAARGVLNTGGTLQDLINYGQSAASNEYANAYSRALGTYDENYRNSLNSYITNFGSALTGYNSRYQTQYQVPYQQLLGQYDRSNANYTGAQDRAFQQQYLTATA